MYYQFRYKETQTRQNDNTYLGFATAVSGLFFPRALGGAGINSSEDGNGRSADDSTFGESGLPFPLDFFCFVDTSDKSCGLTICANMQQKSTYNRQRTRNLILQTPYIRAVIN